jgi:hypothetical protein
VYDTVCPQFVRLPEHMLVMGTPTRRRAVKATMTDKFAESAEGAGDGRGVGNGDPQACGRGDGGQLIDKWWRRKGSSVHTVGDSKRRYTSAAARPEVTLQDIGVTTRSRPKRGSASASASTANAVVRDRPTGLPATADGARSSRRLLGLKEGLVIQPPTGMCRIRHRRAAIELPRGDELLRFWKALENRDADTRARC